MFLKWHDLSVCLHVGHMVSPAKMTKLIGEVTYVGERDDMGITWRISLNDLCVGNAGCCCDDCSHSL